MEIDVAFCVNLIAAPLLAVRLAVSYVALVISIDLFQDLVALYVGVAIHSTFLF